MERRDDVLFFTHYSFMKDVPGYTSSQAYQLAVYVDLVRYFVGRHWVPEEIGIEHPTVPTVMKEHFPGTRVLPSQRVGYIAIPRSCLSTSAPGENSKDESSEPLPLADCFDYAETVRALLKPYLAEGYPSAQLAASLMDTSVRTLARKLSECNVTYRNLVDEMRFDLAQGLLKDASGRISDSSRAVGCDDQAHFARMFRRIGGVSPREFRRATKAGH